MSVFNRKVFLPKEAVVKGELKRIFEVKAWSSRGQKTCLVHLCKLLNISSMPVPNLITLGMRYCKELQLPGIVCSVLGYCCFQLQRYSSLIHSLPLTDLVQHIKVPRFFNFQGLLIFNWMWYSQIGLIFVKICVTFYINNNREYLYFVPYIFGYFPGFT